MSIKIRHLRYIPCWVFWLGKQYHFCWQELDISAVEKPIHPSQHHQWPDNQTIKTSYSKHGSKHFPRLTYGKLQQTCALPYLLSYNLNDLLRNETMGFQLPSWLFNNSNKSSTTTTFHHYAVNTVTQSTAGFTNLQNVHTWRLFLQNVVFIKICTILSYSQT